MNTLTLQQIITQPEGQTFDRKSIKIAAKDLAVTVVAFANADGILWRMLLKRTRKMKMSLKKDKG